jgi:hypothetical protein
VDVIFKVETQYLTSVFSSELNAELTLSQPVDNSFISFEGEERTYWILYEVLKTKEDEIMRVDKFKPSRTLHVA